MFNTTGKVHEDGVKNEFNTIDLLNEYGVYPNEVTHLGGTKNKEDALAGDHGISIKRKENLGGSFDHVNTTKTGNLFSSMEKFKEFKKYTDKLKNSDEEISPEQVEEVREKFKLLCNDSLDSVNEEKLHEFIGDVIINDHDIVINNISGETLYIIPNNGLHPVMLIKQGYKAEVVQDGKIKLSRKIVFRKGDEVVDAGLRIRLTSNNGIKAMLGLSKKNKSSSVVIKLQQDNIKNLVNFSNVSNLIEYGKSGRGA